MKNLFIHNTIFGHRVGVVIWTGRWTGDRKEIDRQVPKFDQFVKKCSWLVWPSSVRAKMAFPSLKL